MVHFLNIPKINHTGQILYNLASRQVYYIDRDDSDEKMHFEVSGICVTLPKLQFTVITRLKYYRNMNVNHSKLGDRIRDRYFTSDSKSTKTIKRETVDLMFENLHADDDEDVVKVALVYLVSHSLLSNVRILVYLTLFFV